MKILFIGDPHLKISTLSRSCQLLRWIDDVINQKGPDMVVNLGDTFDTHAVLRSEILSEFIAHVRRNTHIPYIYLLGNHDMFKPDDSTYHALLPFKGVIHNFTVIDKVTHDNKTNITYVPYIPDHNKFPHTTLPICIAHQTFIGADYGYYRPDVGVDADKVSAQIIISGHIHKRQSFGKVHYVGTPMAMDMNDVDQVKGVMLFNTDSYEMEYIESPFPRWRSLSYEVQNNIEAIHGDIVKRVSAANEDCWIVDLVGSKTTIANYLSSKEWNDLRKATSIRARPKYIDSNKINNKTIKANNLDGILSEYINTIYRGDVDKTIIQGILTQAIETTDKKSV